MKKIEFMAKRLVYSLFVLLGLSIFIFILSRVIPGDPARAALGAKAPEWAVEKMREEMYFNKSLYFQYYHWVRGVLHGDFGISLVTRRPVYQDIKRFLPATLELALYVGIFVGIMAVTLGILAGWYVNTWVDNLVRLIAYLGVATPSFIWAIFFVLIFSYFFKLLPTMGRLTPGMPIPPTVTGMFSIDALIAGRLDIFFDALKHLVLPVLSLGLGPLSQEARITRVSIADNMKKDYIASERSCGIPEKTIMFKYILKPSLIPTISLFGLDFAGVLAQAFLIESIFNWPGISRYGMVTILRKDLNSMVAVVLVLGIVFVITNIIVDLVVGYLDPRINLKSGMR